MRPKSLILLALALGCGLVASIGISQVMEHNSKPGAKLETVPIYIAVHNINLGDTIDEKMVSYQEWPKDKVRAREWFLEAIRIDPDQATAHLNLGTLYLDEGSDGKARDSFQRALELNPDDGEARYQLGRIGSRRGDRPEGR